MTEFGITIGERPAMFIAQVAHESGAFKYTSELWGPTRQQLRYDDGGSLARALGNGPGEGFAWRGHGFIQVTGYLNHKKVAEYFKIPISDIAAWLTTPAGACRGAAQWWSANGCNALADAFAFVDLTKRINGGYNGLAERTQFYHTLSSIK
jgi:putative chitinase